LEGRCKKHQRQHNGGLQKTTKGKISFSEVTCLGREGEVYADAVEVEPLGKKSEGVASRAKRVTKPTKGLANLGGVQVMSEWILFSGGKKRNLSRKSRLDEAKKQEAKPLESSCPVWETPVEKAYLKRGEGKDLNEY